MVVWWRFGEEEGGLVFGDEGRWKKKKVFLSFHIGLKSLKTK